MSDRQQQIDAWMAVAKALVMSRFDRARLRVAFPKVEATDDDPRVFGGISLQVNPYMPEGLMGVIGQNGRLLGVIDLRGDHHD